MSEMRNLRAPSKRVETGPLQFGEDWPGVFFRGDDALAYALALERALGYMIENPVLGVDYEYTRVSLIGLQRALKECHQK